MKKIIKKLTLLAIVLVLLQGAHISNVKVNAFATFVIVDLNGGTVNEGVMSDWTDNQDGTYSRFAAIEGVTSKLLIGDLGSKIIPPSGKVFAGWSPEPDNKPVDQTKTFVAQWKPAPVETVEEVKDERCEVVIGPTWHWNNDLGVCEEYTVVATSTR